MFLRKFSFLNNNFKLKHLWRCLEPISVFLLILFFFFWIQPLNAFSDPDAFYHLGLTKKIMNEGIFLNLPELHFTHLKNDFTDHHFLYHLFLIPFVHFFGDYWGMNISSALFGTLAVFSLYCVLKKLKIPYASFWGLSVLFSPAFVFRMHLPKAGSLSVVFILWGVYFLFTKKYKFLYLLAFFYVWLYGGFPLLLGICGIFILSEVFLELKNSSWTFSSFIKKFKKIFSKKGTFHLLGGVSLSLFLGLLMNPYFPQNFYFYWVQTFQIALWNFKDVVHVGAEWYSYDFFHLVFGNIFTFSLLLFSSALFFLEIKKIKKENLFLFLMMLFFLFYTFKSRRNSEYFIPFATLFSAFSFALFLEGKNYLKMKQFFKEKHYMKIKLFRFEILNTIFVSIALVSVIVVGTAEIAYAKLAPGGWKWNYYDGVSEWLNTSLSPNTLVFHDQWDDFPILFYKSPRLRYLVGLDPTFMYVYDRDKYFLWRDIIEGKVEKNLNILLLEEFGANIVLVNHMDSPKFLEILKENKFFKEVYEDSEASVFKIQ